MNFVQKSNSLLSLFFTEIMSEKKSFLNILNRKQAFLDQKIEVLKRTKKWTFFKGVSPWILSKNRSFSYLPFSKQRF